MIIGVYKLFGSNLEIATNKFVDANNCDMIQDYYFRLQKDCSIM